MDVTLTWKERRSEKKSKTKQASRTFKNVHVATEAEAKEFAEKQAAALKIENFDVTIGIEVPQISTPE